MWKTIRPTLAKIFGSRKALAAIAGSIVWALSQFGLVTTPEQVLPLLGLIGFYLLGQGLADFRSVGDKAHADAYTLGKPPAE